MNEKKITIEILEDGRVKFSAVGMSGYEIMGLLMYYYNDMLTTITRESRRRKNAN